MEAYLYGEEIVPVFEDGSFRIYRDDGRFEYIFKIFNYKWYLLARIDIFHLLANIDKIILNILKHADLWDYQFANTISLNI